MGTERNPSPTSQLTIVLVGQEWAVEPLRKSLTRLGHKVLRRDPMRARASLGDKPPRGPLAPPCDVVILTGIQGRYFHNEWEGREGLFAGKLVLDMTHHGSVQNFNWNVKSLIEQLEERIPSARAVGVGSLVGWDDLLVKGYKDTVYYCGSDEAAKAEADALLRSLGFNTDDLGGIDRGRMLQMVSGFYARMRVAWLGPREPFSGDEWTLPPEEAEGLVNIEVRAKRIRDTTASRDYRELIRWQIGGDFTIDLVGFPDVRGYDLARKLVEWEEAARDETVAFFHTMLWVSELGGVSFGHRRSSLPGHVHLLVDPIWSPERFGAVLTQDQFLALLGQSRALLAAASAAAVAEAAKATELPTILFARAIDGKLVIGDTSLPDGTEVQLAPLPHLEQEGRFTRIHAPDRFDAEVFHVPTENDLKELAAPNRPSPTIEVMADYELPAIGWADVTIRVGAHEVTLSASDSVEACVTGALRGLVRALENDALPYRARADEEGNEVSIGARRTSDGDMVLLSVSNLRTASLEALVPRAELLEELKNALKIVGTGEWMR